MENVKANQSAFPRRHQYLKSSRNEDSIVLQQEYTDGK